LYGAQVALRFFKKIRNQEAFSGAEELVAQIGRDVEAVRGYFARER
jgi:FAD synthase